MVIKCADSSLHVAAGGCNAAAEFLEFFKMAEQVHTAVFQPAHVHVSGTVRVSSAPVGGSGGEGGTADPAGAAGSWTILSEQAQRHSSPDISQNQGV